MPIYEYGCKACGFEKDVLQKMSDEPLKVCLQCGEETFMKKISAAGFRLSGSGWYETDFKTGKKKNLAGAAADNTSSTSNAKADSSGSGSSNSGSSNSGSDKATKSPSSSGTEKGVA